MSISSTGAATSNSATSANSGASPTGAALSPSDFLNLFMTSLQYQDPTSPMDTNTMLQQTAAMENVEEMTNMSTTLNSLQTDLLGSQIEQGATMIGKTISANVSGTPVSGVVQAAQIQNGALQLMVGSQSVPISSVTSIA